MDFVPTDSGRNHVTSTDSSSEIGKSREQKINEAIQFRAAKRMAEITHQNREVCVALLSQAQEPHVQRAFSEVLVEIENARREGHELSIPEILQLTDKAVLRQFSGEADAALKPVA